jgi:hypothetical protein
MLGLCAALILATGPQPMQAQEPGQVVGLPDEARALEGRPDVRVDTTREGTTRRVLDAREAGESRLTIRVLDGRLYWGTESRPLNVASSGDFTYLSSATEPGRYVRVRRLNDRFTYVEHVDKELGSVTYWGELRIVVGR